MKIFTDTSEGSTVIQNSFIDQYMPHANGEFVKVYLYLLRCANSGRDLSLSSIADVFEHTEKDIRRALTYWEKQSLLRIRLQKDATIESLTFMEPKDVVPSEPVKEKENTVYREKESTVYREKETAAYREKESTAYNEPTVPLPNREELERGMSVSELSEEAQQELRQLFFVAEQYLQRPISATEQNDFVYYYHILKFSADLIEYLLEYCISRGATNRHYMKKVALAWSREGVRTVHEAKQTTSLFNKKYFTILKAFGIRGRNPAPPEQEFMDAWMDELAFSMEMILEACSRTILQIHTADFKYADRILRGWHKNGVHNLQEVQEQDRRHFAKQEEKKAASKEQTRTAKNNRFNNFNQRDNDYSSIERRLLGQ